MWESQIYDKICKEHVKSLDKIREKKLDINNRERLQKKRFDFLKSKTTDAVKAGGGMLVNSCQKMETISTPDQADGVKGGTTKNITRKNRRQLSRPLPSVCCSETKKLGFPNASLVEEASDVIHYQGSNVLYKGCSSHTESNDKLKQDWSPDKEHGYHVYEGYVSALYSNHTKITDFKSPDKSYYDNNDMTRADDGNTLPVDDCHRGLDSQNRSVEFYLNENQSKSCGNVVVDDNGTADGSTDFVGENETETANSQPCQPNTCNNNDDCVLTRDDKSHESNKDMNEIFAKTISGNHRKSKINWCRNENHPDEILTETIEWDSGQIQEEKDIADLEGDSEYDFDGEFDDQSEAGDLSNFDFEHMTKEPEALDVNQMYYASLNYRNDMQPVGYILRNLRSSELRLNSLALGTKRIKMMCSALVFNNYVRILEISQDVINCQAMAYLVEAFGDNEIIDQLFLHDNNMGRPPAKILLEFLIYSDQFTNISLSGNRLPDDVGVMIAWYINGSHNLTVIDLSCNQFGMDTAEALNRALSRNTSVHTMSLRWNHMSGKAMDAFLKCLLKNRSLINLDLSWNGFEHESVHTLCKALRVNTTLTTLDISTCRITGVALMEICAALKKNTALKNLSLANNIFSCQSVYEFIYELQKHKGPLAIKELDFQEMPVLRPTKEMAIKLMIERDLMMLHGPILGRYEREETDEDILLTLNPTIILKEFGGLLGMDLVSLFEYMDDDNSGALSREEIKDGLLSFNIPLPEMSLDLLIRQLDRDGDGAISLQELMMCESQGNKARIHDILYNREKQATDGETSSVRCRKILRRMMIEQEKKRSVLDQEEEAATKEQNNNSTIVQNPQDGDVTKLPAIQDNNKVTG